MRLIDEDFIIQNGSLSQRLYRNVKNIGRELSWRWHTSEYPRSKSIEPFKCESGYIHAFVRLWTILPTRMFEPQLRLPFTGVKITTPCDLITIVSSRRFSWTVKLLELYLNNTSTYIEC